LGGAVTVWIIGLSALISTKVIKRMCKDVVRIRDARHGIRLCYEASAIILGDQNLNVRNDFSTPQAANTQSA